MNNTILKAVAVMFLIREEAARTRKDHGAAVAYANAYDWICSALEGREDSLSLFDGFDQALDFVKAHSGKAPWEYEEIFKGQ